MTKGTLTPVAETLRPLKRRHSPDSEGADAAVHSCNPSGSSSPVVSNHTSHSETARVQALHTSGASGGAVGNDVWAPNAYSTAIADDSALRRAPPSRLANVFSVASTQYEGSADSQPSPRNSAALPFASGSVPVTLLTAPGLVATLAASGIRGNSSTHQAPHPRLQDAAVQTEAPHPSSCGPPSYSEATDMNGNDMVASVFQRHGCFF